MFTETQVECQRSFLRLAQKEHEGQTRRNGVAYISHPVAVAKIIEKQFKDKIPLSLLNLCICSAFIHDVFEDTECTADTAYLTIFNDFVNDGNEDMAGIISPVIESALIVSNIKNLPYEQFIKTVVESNNAVSIIVKYCDLIHNMSCCIAEMENIETTNKKTARQLLKYSNSVQMLIDAVKEIV